MPSRIHPTGLRIKELSPSASQGGDGSEGTRICLRDPNPPTLHVSCRTGELKIHDQDLEIAWMRSGYIAALSRYSGHYSGSYPVETR
jgi:hypothetical protein